MQLPSQNTSAPAVFPSWPLVRRSGTASTSSQSMSTLITINGSPLPTTTLITKRTDQQCLWHTKTWPNGGVYPDVVTATLPCSPVPLYAAGTPITLDGFTELEPTSTTMETTAVTYTGASGSGFDTSKVLGMDQDGVEALVIVLPLIAVGLAVMGFFVGREVGKKREKGKGAKTAALQAGAQPGPGQAGGNGPLVAAQNNEHGHGNA